MKCTQKNIQQQAMRRNKGFQSLSWLCCFALAICFSLVIAGQACAAEIQLVCNEEIPDESLTQKDVRNIFLGKTLEWDNKEKVVITIVKDKTLHKRFLKTFVGMTPSKFRTYWKQMIFTGKSSSSPKTLKTEEDLLEFIAETEGAIGYVSADAPTDGVKVLTTSK